MTHTGVQACALYNQLGNLVAVAAFGVKFQSLSVIFFKLVIQTAPTVKSTYLLVGIFSVHLPHQKLTEKRPKTENTPFF